MSFRSLTFLVAALVAALDLPAGGTAEGQGIQPGQTFRDCSDCPEMVVVPQGTFLMGSSAADAKKVLETFEPAYMPLIGRIVEIFVGDETGLVKRALLEEQPQHSVTVPRAFAMGKYTVTRGEFAAFIRDTGHSMSGGCRVYANYDSKFRSDAGWMKPGFFQTDREPVVCVNWSDAQAYVSWLNGKLGEQMPPKSGGPYHLPSEAEWEYAARSGTQTLYWWGDSIGSVNAVCDGCGSPWDRKQPRPVDSLRLNPFGLGMLGNAWEWTEDCWNANYDGAPVDGTAWTTGDCSVRVMRGGGFNSRPWLLRPSQRINIDDSGRANDQGFRVARTLP
jgi:formylglycine-generating enzyme required for sulfatase activity